MIKKLINDSGNIVVFDYAIAYSNGYEIWYGKYFPILNFTYYNYCQGIKKCTEPKIYFAIKCKLSYLLIDNDIGYFLLNF